MTRAARGRAAFLAVLVLSATAAPAQDVLDRLKSLDTDGPTLEDAYAVEAEADRDLIAVEADTLFDASRPTVGAPDGPVRAAVFTAPDCTDCGPAVDALAALAERLGVRATVIDVSEAANADLMRRLTLDLLPSYVLPDSLVRGAMPAIVLERYLSD